MSQPPMDYNPYASPAATLGGNPNPNPYSLDPKDLTKVEAVIKDAGQWWLAVAISVLCSAIGFMLIGIWYFARLMQWRTLAPKYPVLLVPTADRTSLPSRFQKAKTNLILGMSIGAVLALCIFALLFVGALFG